MSDLIETLYEKILEILPDPNKEFNNMLKDLKSVDSTQTDVLLNKIYSIMEKDAHLLNRINFEILLNDSRMPKLSYLLSVLYYFYSRSPFTKGRYTENEYPLPVWLQKIIILGDNEKFKETKKLALFAYISFT